MTREEAIIILNGFKNNPLFSDTHAQAFDMAISALSENKGDLISRKSLLNKINAYVVGSQDKEFICKLIREMPSVENKQKWIPVSERLPEKFRFVNCTCHSLIDDREDWVVETVYVPQPPNSPYSDWGNIPMLNDKECEVTAWVHREIPEPYKAEKSGEE